MLIKPLGPARPFTPTPVSRLTTVLADGNRVTISTVTRAVEDEFGWETTYDGDVFAQLSTPDGAPLGSPFRVDTQDAGDQSASQVVALATGGFMVLWTDFRSDFYGNYTTFYGQMFAEDGARAGDDFYVGQNPGTLKVEALADGGVVIATSSQFNFYPYFSSIGFQVRDDQGGIVASSAPDYEFGEDVGGIDLATLADGGFVISWSNSGDPEATELRSALYVQAYDADGTNRGDAVVLSDAQDAYGAQLEPLAGGGFVATWRVGDEARARIFDAGGEAIDSDIVLTRDEPIGLSVNALEWGGMIVQWRTVITQPDDEWGENSIWTTHLMMFDGEGRELAAPLPFAGYGIFTLLSDGTIALDVGGTRQIFALPVVGSPGADALAADDSGQALFGLGGDDVLTGGDGADSLDGGDGADRMAGGRGDDSYYADDADVIVEEADGGIDTVYAVYGIDLPDHVENQVLLGGEISPGGNGATGNAGDNVLDASLARPVPYLRMVPTVALDGLDGSDRLIGSDFGFDDLDGGSGADIMIGGAQADTYHVDDPGDRVIERNDPDGAAYTQFFTGTGYTLIEINPAGDEVIATIDYHLPAFVERLTLAGAVLNGWGNARDNVLSGNAAANRLEGAGGTDTLYGHDGNDVLAGGAGDDWLIGGGGDDRLIPAMGNGKVDGGAGRDVLVLDGLVAGFTFITDGATSTIVGPAGSVRFVDIEAVQFADGVLVSDALAAALKPFDGLRYVAGQADLRAVIGLDATRAAQHYLQYGMAEDRDPAGFDPLQYVAGYSDLRVALGADAAAATRHYIQYGATEGRSDARFDGLQYAASYGDLSAAFRTDAEAAARHYIQFGAREGRSADSFDGMRYVASNRDLIVALGSDDDAAAAHYIQFGRGEGRSTTGFDALAYGAANADLNAAFGKNVAALTEHYIDFGYFEQRSLGTPAASGAEMVIG